MFHLPNQQTKKWTQANGSDIFGSVVQTKNINFDKDGYLELSPSVRATMNASVDTDFDEPIFIVRSEDHGYFVQTHDSPFKVDANRILAVRPTQVTASNVPTGAIQADGVFNSGLMIVSEASDATFYDPNANTWTDTNISLSSTTNSQHPIANFLSLAAFAIANVNTVKLYSNPPSATPTLLRTLTIPADFYITSIKYFNQNLYIGTMNRFGGKAYLYVWNGVGTSAQAAFVVDSGIIFDLAVFQDSIALITGSGQLLRFNGTGFSVLDNLPIYYTGLSLADETNVTMFHNCLKSNGELLLVNVTQSASDALLTTMPGGIWCYDIKLGFAYHRYSNSGALVTPETIATASVNTTTDVITVAAAPITGTEVLYYDGQSTALAPLTDATRYYVIKTGSTTIKLATTYANAIAGTSIDLTGTGNNAQVLIYAPNTDFGQFATDRLGAILPIDRIVAYPQFGTDMMMGGNINTRTVSDEDGVLSAPTVAFENRGYAITPWVLSDGTYDHFHHVALTFSPFKGDLDKIIIKYRLADDRRDTIINQGSRWLATWTSSTTFTTTETEFSVAVVGDEVEFLKGGGAGILAHITTISSNAGTYTVTIDESYAQYQSGDTCRFVSRNWKKLVVISDDEKLFWEKSLGPTFQGTRIQFKIELRGIQTRIESFRVNNKQVLTLAK